MSWVTGMCPRPESSPGAANTAHIKLDMETQNCLLYTKRTTLTTQDTGDN